MTLPSASTNRSGPFAANGVNRSWSFDFKVVRPEDAELEVFDAAGALTVVTSGFTITGLGDNAGGIITYPLAPTDPYPSGTSVFVRRRTDFSQPYAFANQGAFLPEMHERAFDRLAAMIQDHVFGTYGARFLFGTGAPSNINTGSVNDFYLDIAANRLYGPKTGAGWGAGILIIGPQGIQGPQGNQGVQGIQGVKGDTGTGLNLRGIVATTGSLPPSGNTAGDAFLVTANSHVYVWNGSAWVDGGALQGPQGIQGPQGDPGTPGDPTALLAATNVWTAQNTFSRGAGGLSALLRNTQNINDGEQTHLRIDRGDGSGAAFEVRTLGDGSNGDKETRIYQGGLMVLAFTGTTNPYLQFMRQAIGPLRTLTDAATVAWDHATQQNAKVVLGGNRTLGNPTNTLPGGVYNLLVQQDATGGRTLNLSSGIFQFPGGTEPVVAAGANAKTLLTFFNDGSALLGIAALNFS